MSLPTSAALLVLYFRHTPETGSNVFTVKDAGGVGSGGEAGSDDKVPGFSLVDACSTPGSAPVDCGAAACFSLFNRRRRRRDVVSAGMVGVYLVVMRV